MRFQAGLLPLRLHAHPKSFWPLTFPLRRTRSGPVTPSQVSCCVVPEMWGTEGSLELLWKPLTSSLLPRLTLLAGLPLFSFLKHVLTNVPLL